MTVKNFFSKIDSLVLRILIQNATIVILVVAIIVESVVFFYSVRKQRVIIVPSYVDRSFYVELDKASPEYIRMMTESAVNYLTNYTPETIEDRFKQFLQYVHPSGYQTVFNSLQPLINESKKYLVYQSYVVEKISLEGDTIIVEGFLRRYVADKLVLASRNTFKIKYVIEGGKYYVVSVERL